MMNWTFLLDERAAGRPVSNLDLKDKAVEFARGIQGMDEFKGSDGWLRNWKKRNHVAVRRGTNESQKIPEDYAEQIADFQDQIKRFRREHDYTAYNILNMDQTMCRFDMNPGATNEVRGGRDVRIASTGGAKRGFTVALCGSASGHKKPAYIVLKEPNGRIPPRVFANLRIPGNVRVTCSPNGWMTGEKMQDWIQRILGPNNDDIRRLLVLDRARIHTMQATRDTLNGSDIDHVFIPGGCTPIVQPADVCWNSAFKSEMRKQYKLWRRQDLRTAQGNLKMASRQDVINWVSHAWANIDQQVLSRSFKCCGITTAMDGSEDHMLTDNVPDALNAADRQAYDGREGVDLIFDEEGEETDSEFEGFSDVE